MADLSALAERVEKLGGSDRELDAQICVAVLPFPHVAYNQRNAMRPRGAPPLDKLAFIADGYARKYTASLDAAMTLVPEGWQLYAVDASIGGHFYASLRGPIMPCNDPDREGIIGVPAMAAGCAKSLTFALTAAALRARASITRTTGDGDGNNG